MRDMWFWSIELWYHNWRYTEEWAIHIYMCDAISWIQWVYKQYCIIFDIYRKKFLNLFLYISLLNEIQRNNVDAIKLEPEGVWEWKHIIFEIHHKPFLWYFHNFNVISIQRKSRYKRDFGWAKFGNRFGLGSARNHRSAAMCLGWGERKPPSSGG